MKDVLIHSLIFHRNWLNIRLFDRLWVKEGETQWQTYMQSSMDEKCFDLLFNLP